MNANMELTEIQFATTVLMHGFRNHSVHFQPQEWKDLMNSVLTEYNNSTMVTELVTLLKTGLSIKESDIIETGSNETFIRISSHDVIFDMEYVTQLKPVKMGLGTAIDLFEKYLDYLMIYENGKIPGLIPTEKLSEWRIVPISQIKEEFL